MTTEKDNTKSILRIGFAAIILLLLIVAAYSLYRVDQLTQRLASVVENNIKKVELANRLHDTVNNRWISLRKIVATNDDFERDEELQHFYTTVRPFEEARKALLDLPLSAEEQQIIKTLTTTAHKAQPLIRNFVEGLLVQEQAPSASMLAQIKQKQDGVIAIVNGLGAQIKREALLAVSDSKEEVSQTYVVMSILMTTIILLAVTIARIVSHYVNKKNQAMANVMKVKSRFLANMSHEIRTPLTAMIGFAEILLKPNLDYRERQAAANTIIRNGAHLQHIVDEILDLSKDEANKLAANKTDVWLLELMDEIEATLVQLATRKGIRFEIEYLPPLPRRIITDPVKLKQIIFNLCNNAIKFTDQGSVKLNISCNVRAQQLHFDIIDTGIGIGMEEIKKIFKPFEQADTSTTRRFGGTGLGLFLSRRFAELLGGTLSVDSEYGQGSCFTLSIPTGEISDSELITNFEHRPPRPSVIQTDDTTQELAGKVLLAEDTKDNQLLVRAFLKDTNVELTTVDDGQQAIHAAVQGQFDLVLMDIQMPVMNGIQATRLLRDKGWTGPILALTANVLPEDCEHYRQEGFDDVIGKPLSRSTLLEKLSPYLVQLQTDGHGEIYSALLGEGPEFRPAIEHFVQQAQTECEQLTTFLHAQNWSELQQQLHRLKGCGGGVGFPLVTELARDAETHIKEGDYADVTQDIDKLVAVLKRLRITRANEDNAA